jgi:uncharacterized protein YdaT
MTKKMSQHIVKNPSGGWAVKKGGSSKATRIYETQKEAIEQGKKIAQNQKAELYIHGKDGKIQNKNSYGKDSCPPKDKK